jgi:hypothetical protein
MKKQYKEFNLEEALQGNVEVETKSGYKVKEMYLFEATNNEYPLVCLLERKPGEAVGDFIYQYNKEGKFDFMGEDSINDLHMYKKPTVCYVNVYKTPSGKLYLGSAYKTKEQAIDGICPPNSYTYIKTIEVDDQTYDNVNCDSEKQDTFYFDDLNQMMSIIGDMFGGSGGK